MVDCGRARSWSRRVRARPTLRDIFEPPGVSATAVSLAIRGDERISQNRVRPGPARPGSRKR